MQSGSFAFQNIKRESKTKELKQEKKKTVTLLKKACFQLTLPYCLSSPDPLSK